MSNYLKHKPGSIEELVAKQGSYKEDSGYQKMFRKELDKAGKGIGSMSPAEKKAFFNKIDKKYTAKGEDLNNKDKPAVKDVVGQLKKAVKAHTKQAKDLEKAVSSEGMETMVPNKKDDPKDLKRKQTMTAQKASKIEMEPKVDYDK
tara:strand:+ start:384 stop:821 length:438 start_codon:yes stop_codon:yes gene_type:complete